MIRKILNVVIYMLVIFLSFEVVEAVSIPKLDIYGNIDGMNSKEDERKIKVSYHSDEVDFESYAKLRVQGASSLQYEKKNYNITFYDDIELKNKKNIDFKWGDISKYTLKANWIDKSQSRNNVSGNIYSSIQKKYGLFDDTLHNGVVDGFSIEIYENGKFLGIYTLNLHKDSMFEFDESNPNHLLVASKASNLVTNFKKEENVEWNSFEVEYGEESEENLEKLNRLINFVNNSTDEEFVEHFEEYFNFDAILNYYCFMMFAELVDNTNNNLFLVTYDGKVWYPSMYDMDISWGTSKKGELIPYDEDMSFARKGSKLWKRFEKNFSDYIVVRYFELREEILTKDNVLKEFYSFYDMIPESSFQKEQERWKDIPGYDIKQIEEFLDVRIPFIDLEIEKLKTDNYDSIYKEFYIRNRVVEDKNLDKNTFLVLGINILLLVFVFFAGAIKKNY